MSSSHYNPSLLFCYIYINLNIENALFGVCQPHFCCLQIGLWGAFEPIPMGKLINCFFPRYFHVRYMACHFYDFTCNVTLIVSLRQLDHPLSFNAANTNCILGTVSGSFHKDYMKDMRLRGMSCWSHSPDLTLVPNRGHPHVWDKLWDVPWCRGRWRWRGRGSSSHWSCIYCCWRVWKELPKMVSQTNQIGSVSRCGNHLKT